MAISFSDHALRQLKERKISKAEVENVLREPDKLIRQFADRYCAVKFIRKAKMYLLVVVYDRRNSEKEVVTAFITSKVKKYL